MYNENKDIPLNIHLSSSPESNSMSYQDFLVFNDDDLFNMQTMKYDNDPINDPGFMAFLSSYSTSLPTQPFLTSQPTETLSTDERDHSKKKTSSVHTKIGKCQHPKHVIYRQEKHTLLASTATPDEKSVMKATPRRGRPPKGSKSIEFEVISPAIVYPIVELTVRPLPKRLEKVVGKSNIKVCLTCLKRSDTDPEYIKDEKYIGPQKK